MKKFLLCLLAVLMTIPAVSAQFSTYAEFKNAVAEVNAICPVDLTPLGYVSSVELTDSPRRLTYTLMITNEMISYELMSTRKQVLKDNVSQLMCTDQMKMLIQPCVKFQVSFCFRYKWHDGQTIDVIFSVSELSTLYNTEVDQDQVSYNMVEQMIANESAQCPIKVDEGMIEQSVYRFEDNIYYEILVDETKYDISSLNTNQSLLRKYMQDMLATPGMRVMIKCVADCGYNVVFLLVGSDTGRTCEMKFTNDELKQIIQ